ncbi:MAG: hypothetical protein AAGB51_15140 [Planctomycetota bacterium]
MTCDVLSLRRRGVALLLVIAVMLIGTSAAIVAARASTTTKLSARMSDQDWTAFGLLASTDEPIQWWLTEASSEIVLDPDVMSPRVPLLVDTLGLTRDTDATVRITAYDQCGMLPRPLAATLGEQLDLPDRVVESLASSEPAPGLDTLPIDTLPFPWPVGAKPAVGDLIATHNPLPSPNLQESSNTTLQLNVNTAPRTVLDLVFEAAGLGNRQAVMSARSRGESAPTDLVLRQRAGDAGNAAGYLIRLVSASDTWSFRIDIQVGSVHHAWWATYANDRGSWRMVQRLAIPH